MEKKEKLKAMYRGNLPVGGIMLECAVLMMKLEYYHQIQYLMLLIDRVEAIVNLIHLKLQKG